MIARLLSFVLLLLFAGQVEAVERCFPKTPLTPVAMGTTMTRGTYLEDALPDKPQVIVSYRGHWCPQPDGTWAPILVMCIEGRTCASLSMLESAALQFMAEPDPVKAVFTALDANKEPPLSYEKQAWIEAAAVAQQQMAETRPKDKVYVVKTNPRCTTPTGCTRPVYELKDGVVGTKEIGRSDVGATCSLSRSRLATGSDFWAEFAPSFVAGAVTLCTLKPE